MPTHSCRTPSARAYIILWTAFAALAGSAKLADLYFIRQWHDQKAEYQRQSAQLDEQVARILKPLKQARSDPPFFTGANARPYIRTTMWEELVSVVHRRLTARSGSITRHEVEALLNDGEPFFLSKPRTSDFADEENLLAAVYSDKQTGIKVELVFDGDVYKGAQRLWPQPTWPRSNHIWGFTSGLWYDISDYLYYGWLAIVLLLPFLGRYRILAAQLPLMIGIILILERTPCTGSNYTWWQFARNLPTHGATVVFAYSVAALALCWSWKRVRSRIRCPVCDYNLAGNTTGICPECGSKMPEEIRMRLPTFTTARRLSTRQNC